jgi:hypothetical protein
MGGAHVLTRQPYSKGKTMNLFGEGNASRYEVDVISLFEAKPMSHADWDAWADSTMVPGHCATLLGSAIEKGLVMVCECETYKITDLGLDALHTYRTFMETEEYAQKGMAAR